VPVALIATGGTIASLRDPASGAVRPAVSAAELVASVPELSPSISRVQEIETVNGWNMTPETMLAVARAARVALQEPDVVGAVVTHGTDTVEETAFLCDLLVDSEKPVVFAAAMRSGDEPSADGPRNLLAAARVAASEAASGCGALLVMNDEVHAARWVRKVHSFRVNAFASPGPGPVGELTPDALRLRAPAARVSLPVPSSLVGYPVPVIQAYTGLEEHLIEAVIDSVGAAGVVLEGTGLGNLPGTAMPGIAAARRAGLPVVVATRVAAGGTGIVYGGPGGGVTLRELGVVAAHRLSAAKARLLLMALLATEPAPERVPARFAELAERLR
jgi:L-asparaginase